MIETSLEVLALETAESSLLQDTNISPSNNSVIFFIFYFLKLNTVKE